MATFMNIDALKPTVLRSVATAIDERDATLRLLNLFGFGNPEAHDGEEILLRILSRLYQTAGFQGMDSRAEVIARAGFEEVRVRALKSAKATEPFSNSDCSLFAALERMSASGSVDTEQFRSVQAKAAARIASALMTVRDTSRPSFERLCRDTLLGEATYQIDGKDVTVDFGWAALDPPAITWDNHATALPFEDLCLALQGFEDANNGNVVTHAFCSKRLWRTHLAPNASLKAAGLQNMPMAAWQAGDSAGRTVIDAKGSIQGNPWDIIWRPLEGKFTTTAGVSSDRWPIGTIVFTSEPGGAPPLFKTFSPAAMMDAPQPGFNYETIERKDPYGIYMTEIGYFVPAVMDHRRIATWPVIPA